MGSRRPRGSRRNIAARDLHIRAATDVPEVSRFYGIVITMYYAEHGVPHFHAKYGDYRASVDIDTGVIRGRFPATATSMVLEWLALHRRELLENWQAAREHRPLQPVPPLE